MAGTVLENGESAAPCVSVLNGDVGSPHVIKQKNGIRKGFLDNPKTSLMDVRMSGESELLLSMCRRSAQPVPLAWLPWTQPA